MELRRAYPNWGTRVTRAFARIDALGARIISPDSAAGARLPIFMFFLLGHVAVWTLYAWLSHNNLSSSADLTEAYAWGREFQWGYHKHPPLSAWIAAAWFEFMPRSDWAYFLLSALVVALGYAGIWAVVGQFEKGDRRLAAVMALEFSPIYGFLAIRYNANSVLLLIWPWATWAFLRAVRNPTVLNGLLLGFALAVAMLAKYYSLVLIIGMLAAALIGENRWRLMTSPAMAGMVMAGIFVLTPHLVWLVQADFAPLRYADDQTASSLGDFFGYLIKFPLAQLLYVAPILASRRARLAESGSHRLVWALCVDERGRRPPPRPGARVRAVSRDHRARHRDLFPALYDLGHAAVVPPRMDRAVVAGNFGEAGKHAAHRGACRAVLGDTDRHRAGGEFCIERVPSGAARQHAAKRNRPRRDLGLA